MDGQRRFSAAPVNFDRFVSLNRSHSRSLSPNDELHQMLRPYQSRTASAAVTNGHRKTSAPSKVTKAERRSTDMVAVNSAVTVTIEGPATQAATPPSRSVSGGAAISTTAATSSGTSAELNGQAEPCYYSVDDETAELERPLFSTEEVDPLLRAVQQLGSPLYNPVTNKFVCWKLHTLERRSRASYGDIEGVSCDFCGHTDWLDTLAPNTVAEENDDALFANGGLGMKSEGEETSGHAALPAHSRYMYHCPICEVDICRACLAEVRAEERFHVPCLQCQRCGAYELWCTAPTHQCTDKHVKEEKTKEDVLSWHPTPNPPPPPPPPPPQPPMPPPVVQKPFARAMPPRPPVEASVQKTFAGVAVRSHVQLGLSRRRNGTATSTVVPDDDDTHAVSTVPSPSAAVTAAPQRAATRKRFNSPLDTAGAVKARGRLDVEEVESDVEDHPPVVQVPQRRQHGALPSRAGRAASPSYAAFVREASSAPMPSSVLSTARYEVHLTPRSGEEVEEVRRVSREQHLQLYPPPAVGRASVAYFPTRLAAESCVERATVGAIEALLKRHTRDV